MRQWPVDVIRHPFYDTVRIEKGRRAVAFHEPVGHGVTLFGTGPKHFGDTNMFLSCALPHGWKFSIESLYVEVVHGPGEALLLDPADLDGASLQLYIEHRNYLTIPVAAARATCVVDKEQLAMARLSLNMFERISPAALPMLIGMLPGYQLGFDLSDARLTVVDQNLRVEVVTPGEGAHALRVYLNGLLSRVTQ